MENGFDKFKELRARTKPIRWMIILIIALSFLPALIKFFINFPVDYLWFRALGFQNRYLKVIVTKMEIFFLFGLIFYFLAFFNNLIVKINITSQVRKMILGEKYIKEISKYLHVALIIFMVIFGLAASSWWSEFLKFYNLENFNLSDPVFGKDISFYVFKLPIYHFLKMWSRMLFIFLLAWALILYTLSNTVSISAKTIFVPQHIRIHLGVIIFFLFINYGLGFLLKKFDLVLNQHSIVKGASYTDIYAYTFAYHILFFASLILALSFIYWIFSKDFKTNLAGIIIFLILLVSLNYIYPFFLEKFVVAPNEIEKEKRFIKHTIHYTRMAYDIHKVKERFYDVKYNLKPSIIRTEKEVLKNIRLWDWRPLKMTFKQLQEIRPYYIFSDVDIDRYKIAGEFRQVMLAAREITHSNLPKEARNWINRYLKYTHGYGMVMIPVSQVNQEGLPEFYIKDIPPQSIKDLKIQRPEIYYGETVRDYVIVNTKTSEFDYPSGDGNVYTFYKGNGGIKLNSVWKQFLFSVYLGSIKVLFSDFITHSSRVMIRRNIIERVKELAPFLLLDNDPYMVLVKGHLYWIIDAYTFTDQFPYSEKFNDEINYIRNSIKVIINAYTGKVKFYIVDPGDPIARTFKNIFPDLFSRSEELDKEFREHFRYPSDLFMIQADMYRTYHMIEPDVFYNKEDIWNVPSEIYDENEILMDSYYIINEIDEKKGPEFLNIIPFTPSKKNNMIAWMAARSDGEHYGKLVVFKFPKRNLIYGPMQIEARIDQNPEISRLISLWGQKGSRVIRGNLLVIPIKNSILYVEPLFLQAEKQELPEIKRIIVAYHNNIAMASSLEEALSMALEGSGIESSGTDKDLEASLKELINKALIYYNNGTKALKDGDWTGYGNNMKKLKEKLQQIKNRTP
ncbi:MAG: UPF0182 family protein [Spirochaetes bacterium]|nr:UPF0182 family protein [Spirochaetota bacterium]